MALTYAQIDFEQHEVELKNKPLELIKISPKATVPVLILENGDVLDESLDIMKWALKQKDPDKWTSNELEIQGDELIHLNDTYFKPILDNYKYPQKSEQKDPAYYREQAKSYLESLNSRLQEHRYLVADHITLTDIAIFPFIRQFYMVDEQWFGESDYTLLKVWLDYFLKSELFLRVMIKHTSGKS